MQSFQRLLRRMSVRISARNQFVGTVSGLHAGAVDVEVWVRLDAQHEIAAVATRESAEQLGLALGREVIVLVKAPAMQLVAAGRARGAARNRLCGTVQRIVEGPRGPEVTLDLSGGRTATAVVPPALVHALGLAKGMEACATFKGASALLAVVD